MIILLYMGVGEGGGGFDISWYVSMHIFFIYTNIYK